MPTLKYASNAFLTSVLMLSATSIAEAQSAPQPDELQAIYACKSITASLERLACYDNSVGRFQAAEKSGEVVTVSKTAIEKVERDAFGFNIPSLPSLGKLFGGGEKSPKTKPTEKTNDLTAPVKRAETSSPAETKVSPAETPIQPKPSNITKVTLEIRKTAEFDYKKTRFFMTNGQVWEQVDSKRVRIPKVRGGIANTADISKASMGSFLLRVNGKSAAIRVRRVR